MKKKTNNIFKLQLLGFLTVICFQVSFSSAQKGFSALNIYDYFLAKKTFYKCNKKHFDPAACYGLAVIYSRNDNPFFNLDSAARYINLSLNNFKGLKQNKKFGSFSIDSVSIQNLCDSITWKNFQHAKKEASIKVYDNFLLQNYLSHIDVLKQAIYLRDELEFNHILSIHKSDSTAEFINTHPLSSFLQEALLLKQREIYDEQTTAQTAESFIQFIKKYPANIMLNTAYENLYRIYNTNADVKGLESFVVSYPKAPQNTEAWKLLFSLSVKSFSNDELERFLKEHPAFPFKNSILKELELNKKNLYAYQKEDLYGFIDTSAKLVIPAVFDAVSDFREGLAVVNKNDSVFYINKEGVNIFNQIYADAYVFVNGIAAAKQGSKWAFINRQGQIIGAMFDEINELSDDIYVVKSNGKYGAVSSSGQVVFEPRFQKLGDFKNGFAYYVEDGKYGFVSKAGHVFKPEFEWISDFNEGNLAIIKQNNFYGIVNSQATVILSPHYDQVLKASNTIFIIVKDLQYGFYSGNGCFLTAIAFDFYKEKPVEFYTNGTIFKLLKKNEQALVDANGRISIDFGSYDEVNFASGGLIRVKRKNKYGFTDRKLANVIPYKYQEAQDFVDSTAIVKLKEKYIIINSSGKELFSSDLKIERFSAKLFFLGEEKTDLVNSRGEKVISGVNAVQQLSRGRFIITLNNGEIKLLTD